MEKKPTEYRATACAGQMAHVQTRHTVADGPDFHLPCITHAICVGDREKPNQTLSTFVQWKNHNDELLSRSAKGHHQSNLVEYNAQRAINTLSASADKRLANSTQKITGTARNIGRWKADMFLVLEKMRNEIDLLASMEQRILRAQTALNIICSISTECLELRSTRLGIDLTLDLAQIEFDKEKELITEIGDLFCRTLDQMRQQLKQNKRIKYRLEENWSDKNESYDIDVINLGLNIHSPIIMSHEDAVKKSENTSLSIPEWEQVTKKLFAEAQQTSEDSLLLRQIIDEVVLRKSAKRLREQADAVDIALARYILDTQQVSFAIENDLKQVVKRLGDSEKLVGDLLRVTSNLEKAKNTAETRLHNRLKRPGTENCEDNAQLSIVVDVKELTEQIKTLNDQLASARTGHLGLQEVRHQLEDEARIKRKTISIDSDRCQRVRSFYPSLNVMIGH